jgi:hypothetical protein
MREEPDYRERVQSIMLTMERHAPPSFDGEEIQSLRILVRVAVQFYNYLNWSPSIGDDVHAEMCYVLDRTFVHFDSFLMIMHAYGILEGSMVSTLDWNIVNIHTLRDKYLKVFDSFVQEETFVKKCRLLLDLVKLQIVFAGAFYDSAP